MLISKRFVVFAGLVFVATMVLGEPLPAAADMITPSAVPYHSEDGNSYSYPPGGVDNMIDGELTGMAARGILYDDTTFASPNSPITGYAIFDLGEVTAVVAQAQMWHRLLGAENHLMPKNVTFFYFDDDSPHGYTTSADIASDTHVVNVWTGDLPDLIGTDPGLSPAVVTFDSAITSKRYVGMLLNSSWQDSADWGSDPSNACSQIAEVNFTDVPEPCGVLLLVTGLLGLLCCTWKERR